jgi:hypothetical protein
MKVDKTWVAGAILALLAIGLSVSLVIQFPFPTFKYASPSNRFINVTEDVGPQDSQFMWSNRTLDLMAQAIVIFAAAAGCLAMLRVTQRENNTND